MAAVGTTPNADATEGFNGRKIDRCQDGTLVTFARELGTGDANDEAQFLYSKDGGATWASAAPGVWEAQRGSMFIDLDDYLHFVWKQQESSTSGPGGARSQGYLYYMRGTPNAGRTAWTWSAAVDLAGNSVNNYPDVVAHREGSGWKAHVVCTVNGTGTDNTTFYYRVNITGAGVATREETDIIGGGYGIGTDNNGASIDFHHTGDGKTVAGGTPHLYVGWTAGATGAGKGVRFRKAVYSAGSWTWNPEREIDASRYGLSLVSFFDGTRVVFAGLTNTAQVDNFHIYERDDADTTTTTRLLFGGPVSNPASADYLIHGSAAYDSSGNVYLYGRDNAGGNGSRKINRRKWTRSTATLGPIETIDATGNDAPYLSARRGAGGNAVDVVWTDNTASPYTVQHDRLVLNVAPNAPTGLAPSGNTSIDRTSVQRFSWVFSDPDSGDTQSAYDLRHRRVGTATWTTVSGSTPSQFRDFPGGTFAEGDYEWQVRTYDAQNNQGPSPYSGSEFFRAATPPPGPTIIDPVNNGTVGTSTAPLSWSYPTQQAYQVRVLDPADAVLFDTGVVGGTAGAQTRTVQLEFPENNVTRKLQVRVQDSGSGLFSPYSTVTVTVSYTPPATPTLTVVPLDDQGAISVLVTHPTPTGSQPAVAATEVEVRADTAGDPYRPVGQPIRLSVNSTAYTDRAPAGGVEYAFRARAVGVNETVSLSAWTT